MTLDCSPGIINLKKTRLRCDNSKIQLILVYLRGSKVPKITKIHFSLVRERKSVCSAIAF